MYMNNLIFPLYFFYLQFIMQIFVRHLHQPLCLPSPIGLSSWYCSASPKSCPPAACWPEGPATAELEDVEALGALGALGALLSSGNASALITGVTNTHKLHLEACLHGPSLTIVILEIDYIRTLSPPTLYLFHRHTPDE